MRDNLSKWVTQVRFLLCVFTFACGSQATHVARPEPSIALLEAGAEPRQRLRYELTAHTPERAEMTQKVRTTTAFTNTVLEDGHRSVDFPSLRTVARIEVSALAPTGDAEMAFEVEDVTVLDDVVDPTIRGRVAAEAAAMKGWRGTWRMAPSGTISNIVLDAPKASPSTRNQLSNIAGSIQASVVFPDAEIGIGATWQVTSQQSVSGVTWSRIAKYRLKALTDSTATIDAEISMHAPSQALSVEPNATTRLTSATSTATTELIIPLRGLVATTTSQENSEANFSIVKGHLRITSTVQTETLASSKPLGTATEGEP